MRYDFAMALAALVGAQDRAARAAAWADCERLRRRSLGGITLLYSVESEPQAGEVLDYAARCHETLSQWFRPGKPVLQEVYWLSRRDWRGRPEQYGFPFALGPDAVLPAADVDVPTQLAHIAGVMEIRRGGLEIDEMARRLRLAEPSSPESVYEHLSRSQDFFMAFTAGFILPHELTHGFCNDLGYPQQPRWYYEGLAQWAGYQLQKRLRPPGEADMIDHYYQIIWDRARPHLAVQEFARADKLGAEGLDTPNYAWYHAGLLRMFRELEDVKGGELLPELVRAVDQRHKGHAHVAHDEMCATFSQVTGRDLGDWFRQQWGLT